jgi:NADPH2:quinone reductase
MSGACEPGNTISKSNLYLLACNMKAVGLFRYLPIDNPESLLDVELPVPRATGRDLLVKVQAVAVNPVDTKVRRPKDKVEASPKYWAGMPPVKSLKPGSIVHYSR